MTEPVSVEVFVERCNRLMNGQPPELILQKAHDLLFNVECWTKGARARDQQGRPVRPEDPNAVSWDIEGAVSICCNNFGILPPYFMRLLDHIAVSVREWKVMGVDDANERLDHASILQLLRLAIEHVQSGHGRSF